MQAASRLWATALDLLFPPRCVACKRRGAWLCARCQQLIQPIPDPVCQSCGRGIDSGFVCDTCRHHPLALNGARSSAYFEGPLRLAIHHFKYNGLRTLAGPLGDLLGAAYARYSLRVDLIVPVPLHRSRQSQRGFNQSELLAARLSVMTAVPHTASGLLRMRNTPSQVGLSAAQRRDNVREAFSWQGASLQRQRVLLIDDVCTTGATLEACASALHTAGAASVWALTLARER
jgi:ComF family protein